MLDRVEEFVLLLRQNGVRVSPVEAADAARALELLPLDDKLQVRAALRSTLVKRGSEAGLFDKLFEIFFSGAKALVDGLKNSLIDRLELESAPPEALELLAQQLAAMELSPLTQALLQGDQAELARLLRQATLSLDFRGLQSPLQRSFYARRVLNAAGAPGTESQLAQLLAGLRARGLDGEALESISRQTTRQLTALEEAARRIATREQEARDPSSRGDAGLSSRNLASLTPAEIAKMRELVQKLADKLKDRLARRRKVRRKGALAVRRTLRKNLALGGLPAQLVFRQKRPERPELVVLCDVSDSVRNVSRLMLQFVYTLQAHYARVRSFVFVSELGEVTDIFKKTTKVEEAVERSTAGRVVNLAANSNYGRALELFSRSFLGSVNRRTSVIVIGDGRSNYNPPRADILDDLKRRARRVIWLCPEDKAAWGFGDSEMPAYSRRVDRALPVKSLDDLARAAEEILP